MSWNIYSYNMLITDFSQQVEPDDMVISADTEDTDCILQNSEILRYLKNVSVWAIEEESLFLLVEKREENRTV